MNETLTHTGGAIASTSSATLIIIAVLVLGMCAFTWLVTRYVR